jgi:O-antigen/teichoic acid export membrane protein
MKKWLRRIRGAIGMGLTWAIGWAFVGGLMELIDRRGELVDIWPMVLGIPGFIAGAVFSVLLWIAEGRRRFDELSLPRFGAWGAVVGLLLGVLGVAAGAGIEALPPWLRAAVVIGPTTLLGAISASGTLALARKGRPRELFDAGADVGEVGLTDAEKRELLGGRG